ncbi:hypothetical protein DY000_02050644 [Brassica cretica]|uniref:Secreted protein n=1 Tax=Brassica cretica TaxID=69181 RepID=A0ABQ7EPQ4_BRACR|nr:hypothetical protein DY000_02050644 [Brassica cretica]
MLCSFCLHAKGLQFTATLNLEQYRWAGVNSLHKGFRSLSDDWSIDHLVLPCTFCVARSTETRMYSTSREIPIVDRLYEIPVSPFVWAFGARS